ncbi:MAG: phosphoglycerate kinase [bacterium]|nr:phosphoglycerate kinase [bacterium]
MTYLLRVNLDIKGTKPQDSPRFADALESIKDTAKPGRRVVVLAHRGRPKGKDTKLSLKVFAKPLEKGLKRKVTFIPHFDFEKITKLVKESPLGSIFLLENVRFLPGETKGDLALAKKLASLGDRYINDDFPTSHHFEVSNVTLAKLLPSSLGINFKMELKQLDKIMRSPQRPFVLVIGGAKIDDKLGTIENLFPKVDSILLGGGPANTLLKARGVKIGKSLYDASALKDIGSLSQKQKLVTPIDWRVKKDAILDIGPETEKLYGDIVSEAKTIVWNGPMGKVEDKDFAGGTKALWRAILANKKANIVVGGGDTVSAIALPKRLPKNVFVSTGGGAMLTYLAGGKLPALEAIN